MFIRVIFSFGNLSSEYITLMEQVGALLEGQAGEVSEAVTLLLPTCTITRVSLMV
jgi:hypothetical protein